MMYRDVLIIGAGIAGISAAKAVFETGRSLLLLDREEGFGGVLRQCIHRGFGRGLTGPEYIRELLEDFPEDIETCFSTTVLEIREDKTALCLSREKGLFEIGFSQLILATGCMELTAGMLPIGGTRPEHVYTAGQAQLMSFMGEGFPTPVVILGSGDMGLIMARQLYEQGHEISCIIEKEAAPTAMARNRGILETVPLITNSSIVSLQGEDALEALRVKNLLSAEEKLIPCRCLLVAAGLRPDRSLVRNLEKAPWLSFAGNCLRVYPMVEGIITDARQTARAVCERIEK